jgi:hypothetical protein
VRFGWLHVDVGVVEAGTASCAGQGEHKRKLDPDSALRSNNAKRTGNGVAEVNLHRAHRGEGTRSDMSSSS